MYDVMSSVLCSVFWGICTVLALEPVYTLLWRFDGLEVFEFQSESTTERWSLPHLLDGLFRQ